ncbi:hypothetical protein PPL_07362, partial [Heterostelium album PN500]
MTRINEIKDTIKYDHQDYQNRGFSDAHESTVGDGPATQAKILFQQALENDIDQKLDKCNAETITFRADLQRSMTIVNSGDQKSIKSNPILIVKVYFDKNVRTKCKTKKFCN